MRRLYALLFLLFMTAPAYAVGTIIAVSVMGLTAGSFAAVATAFAINMVVSAVITKAFFSPEQPSGGAGGAGGIDSGQPNPGNRQQIPPATDNKLPVVYGDAYLGGTIIDLSISSDYQTLYYVLAICEVTNNGQDTITFGDVYWGGKRCVFSGVNVVSLVDDSTGDVDTVVAGKLQIYLYRNGVANGQNTSTNAVSIMQASSLTWNWDASKKMTNCAFAIIKMTYDQAANLTGIQQTKFKVSNSRYRPGDCFSDYFQSEVYGAGIPLAQLDTASFTALNTYCAQSYSYVNSSGIPSTMQRFRFDGVISTSTNVMDNLQAMANCCDCLIKYNEIQGKWGVIVQSPAYTVSMALDDSNIISAISITPLDIAASYNIIECKFPESSSQDAFNVATLDLAEVDPSLLFPNEPVNKFNVTLPLVNNSARAQLIANRLVKAGREDLQVALTINYVGIQLEAGDIVTITNANYGWVAKQFRVMKVTENFTAEGQVTADLILTEFNASIYDDVSVTEFQPSPNSGIGSPTFFGALYPPAVSVGSGDLAPIPYFTVTARASGAGFCQYAEIWYSAYPNPTSAQRIFAGVTQTQASNLPYDNNAFMPSVQYSNIPAGDWYFFTRMVNNLLQSDFSGASSLLQWRPKTYQFAERYLAVAYGTSTSGADFSFDPRGKTHFGLFNTPSANTSPNASDYTWYLATPESFGTNNYLIYANRTNRKISVAVDNATTLGIGGAFVPSESSVYDQSIWSGLRDGTNLIDLDARSGQVTVVGTTSVSSADGLLSVNNNTDGTMVVSLQKFLNFGSGVYSKTFTPASVTIDIYGRVVGFTQQDAFYFTSQPATATAGQTSFTVNHIVGQVLVFRNGTLVDTSEYTETSTTVVLSNACAAGETLNFLIMRAVSTDAHYEAMSINVASSTSNSVTYSGSPYQIIEAGDALTFSNTGTPTTYTVQSVNDTTRVITFTGSISGATVGNEIYRYRAAGASYRPYSRYTVDLVSANSVEPTTFDINNGYEQIYVNGVQFNEVDYDLAGNVISGFPSAITGRMTIIMFAANNLGIPCSNITNTVAYSVANAVAYPFTSNPLSLILAANGSLLTLGSGYDYTATSTNYILAQAFANNFTIINQQTYARDGAA